jgi:uroporphyrinogen decarboxylase
VNSRERVLAALDHREPDRVPVSFGEIGLSSIFDHAPFGYRALCDYLGLDDYEEPVSQLDGTVVNADERLLRRLGADLRSLAAGSSFELEHLPDGSVRDEWGLVRRRAGPYWDLSDSEAPLRDATEPSEIDALVHWPDTADPAIWAGKREEAERLRRAGFAVFAVPSGATDVFHNYAFLRGFERWLMDMYDNPRFFHGLAESIVDFDIAYLESFLGPVADVVDLVMMGDDMGSQAAPFMSPDDYRKFCKPHHKRWVEAVRQLAPGARILLHTCGNVYSLIGDFIEIGVDVLNPVQPRARMMEPWRLKRDFGSALSFFGGVDIQELLPFGTPAMVRAGVCELVETMASEGGFILAPSHQFQPDIPPENIVAMYDAAPEHGRPIKGGRSS